MGAGLQVFVCAWPQWLVMVVVRANALQMSCVTIHSWLRFFAAQGCFL
jgi:hypothetical protein